MLKTIKTSEANRVLVTELTNKLGMGSENLIARIAFAYSIARGSELNLCNIKDAKGKEYSSQVLFGDYIDFYVAIVCQHYGLLYRTDYDIPKYIKMHIDDGLELISEYLADNPNLQIFDFVIDQIDKGLIYL